MALRYAFAYKESLIARGDVVDDGIFFWCVGQHLYAYAKYFKKHREEINQTLDHINEKRGVKYCVFEITSFKTEKRALDEFPDFFVG